MTYEDKAATIYIAICKCFNKESEILSPLQPADIDNDFFEGGVAALFVLYQKVTGDEEHDIFNFVAMLNKIVMQNYMERNGCKLEEVKPDA